MPYLTLFNQPHKTERKNINYKNVKKMPAGTKIFLKKVKDKIYQIKEKIYKILRKLT